ncbi:MAG: gamma carbonic anhydrase family protein [Bacteroidaceae bacterium]|nr:gamma carbonic anhydrase family protein [Prevotellaceae bacterium]MDY5632415.1 gamma carbonic anhydrase family protein [Bacteroidaceae bacterium]
MAIIKTLKGMPAPRFGRHCYFSEGAVIVGDVEMGDDCTVWFNAVVRGDVHYIKIGNRTNIQENSCIHTLNGKAPCILGDDVTIGHSVTLHGCEVRDGALVGMGATVLDHAVVGRGAIVAAGALVLSNTQIGDGELWGGVPAKFIKKVDPEQAQALNKTYAGHYVEYSKWYREADKDPNNTQTVTTSEAYRPASK